MEQNIQTLQIEVSQLSGEILREQKWSRIEDFFFCSKEHVRSSHARRHKANPPADFVVVKIHQHSTESWRVSGEVDLLFGHVYELVGELVPMVRVVSAAAPQPVWSYGFLGAGLFAAAARGQFPVATRSADGVYHPSCHQRVDKGRFPRGC